MTAMLIRALLARRSGIFAALQQIGPDMRLISPEAVVASDRKSPVITGELRVCKISRRQSAAIRALDILVAATVLTFVAPLLVVAAVTVWIFDGGPIFSADQRLGRNGQLYARLNFRTVGVESDQLEQAKITAEPKTGADWIRDMTTRRAPRTTRIGDFLQQSGIDRLPQFLNVLRGEMSLVGPRPILAEEIGRYGRYRGYYMAVKPGLTGLWRVSRYVQLNNRRRIALDVAYARSTSLLMNMLILVRTIPALLFARGNA